MYKGGQRLTSISDLQLLQLQANAAYTHDSQGRMCYVNEPGGARAPRFFFGRTREGNTWRYRDDVAEGTMRELERLAVDEPIRDDLGTEPHNLHGFLAALRAESGSTVSEWKHTGPAYRFPDELPPIAPTVTRITRTDLHLLRLMNWDLDRTAQDFERYEPFMAVVEDGAAVSLCHSARLTDDAAEAGLETMEAYRRRGYAILVTAGWAHAIRATGRIPSYSTSWDNLASQAVARQLRLVQYGTDLSLG